jgi:hypothetical protein
MTPAVFGRQVPGPEFGLVTDPLYEYLRMTVRLPARYRHSTPDIDQTRTLLRPLTVAPSWSARAETVPGQTATPCRGGRPQGAGPPASMAYQPALRGGATSRLGQHGNFRTTWHANLPLTLRAARQLIKPAKPRDSTRADHPRSARSRVYPTLNTKHPERRLRARLAVDSGHVK